MTESRNALRCRAGSRRPGAGDCQGSPGDRRSRRGGLPQRPPRPQHRPRHRRTVSAARPDRGAPGLPDDHRGNRSSRRLRRCDGGLLHRCHTSASPRHLDAGRDVALLAEGDPLFYSSYMHLHTRLTQRFEAVIVPGVTSVSAASAAIATPLVTGDQVLSMLPGTVAARGAGPPACRCRRRGDHETGSLVSAVREALSASGRLDAALYVERASTAGQRVLPAADVDDTERAVLLAGDAARRPSAGDETRRRWPWSVWARVTATG